jgi:hypothetical protein
MYSSPSGVALHRSDAASLPASGSDSENAARTSPVAIRGRRRAFCSSVPCRASSVTTMVWVLRMPASDIQP